MKQLIQERNNFEKTTKRRGYFDGNSLSRQKDGLGSRDAAINRTADTDQNYGYKSTNRYLDKRNNKVQHNTSMRRRNLQHFEPKEISKLFMALMIF